MYLLFIKALEANTDTYRPILSVHSGPRKLNINILESEGKSDELPQVAEEHLPGQTPFSDM